MPIRRLPALLPLAGARALLPLAGASALLLAACSGSTIEAIPVTGPTASVTPSAEATASGTPTPTPVESPTPTPTPTPSWVSPFTGEEGPGESPVLIVKLDNTRNAQPHAGLVDADVVYVEEVEYGITRLAAVFSSTVPGRIGPVRSARITDIDLLAQYGKPAFAYSGAQRKMFESLDAASIVDVSPRKGGEGYSRDSSRRAPYNYFLDGNASLGGARKASLSQDIGFVFDAAIPAGGRTATDAQMEWSYASAGFEYKPRRGTYAVSLNDERAAAEERKDGQQADTVVIQYVEQRPSIFNDKGGGNTPHAETVGSGRAIVLRDGLGWKVRWERPDRKSGTTFTMEDGSPMPFKPGQVWVVLLDNERKAKVEPWTDPLASPPSPSATPGVTSSASASAAAP